MTGTITVFPSQGGPELFAKLAKIIGEVGRVSKNGRNEFHKYDYVTETDLVEAVRQKLSEAGVAYFFSVTGVTTREGSEKGGPVTEITTAHTFGDGKTGQQFTVTGAGSGQDVGDKGLYKAITGAQKYALMKTFLIATGDDPEADTQVDKRNAGDEIQTPKATVKKTAAKKAPAEPVQAQTHEKKVDEQGKGQDDSMTTVIPKGDYKGRTVGSLNTEESTKLLKVLPAGGAWAKAVQKRLDYLKSFEKLPEALKGAAKQMDLETAGAK